MLYYSTYRHNYINNMNFKSIRITDQGQITIPKEIRDIIKSQTIMLQIKDGIVSIIPILDVGGCLSHFNKKETLNNNEEDNEKTPY